MTSPIGYVKRTVPKNFITYVTILLSALRTYDPIVIEEIEVSSYIFWKKKEKFEKIDPRLTSWFFLWDGEQSTGHLDRLADVENLYLVSTSAYVSPLLNRTIDNLIRVMENKEYDWLIDWYKEKIHYDNS